MEEPRLELGTAELADRIRPIDDPRALTILTTEHWSLLSARSLVYNESFARGGMFLTFLSATVVALGLVSAATGFNREFLEIAAVILAIDLFVGLATLGRVASTSAEDIRCLQGMNRLRHAYHEMVPGLDRYFVAGRYDDLAGVFSIYGTASPTRSFLGVLHGLTTMPGMLAVICSIVAGVLAGVVVLLAVGAALPAAVAALVAFGLANGAAVVAMNRMIGRLGERMAPAFPTPADRADGPPAL